MNRTITTITISLVAFVSCFAQNFSKYFEDTTLRLDYVLAGNAEHHDIFLDGMKRQPVRWAGRRNNLAEVALQGNGQLTVRDHASHDVIYTWTFSTLFQEWLLEDEAKTLKRSFEASYNIPFPKAKADVTIELKDNTGKTTAMMSHTIDPTDILIRQMQPNGIPNRYIWRGGDIADCIDFAIVAEGYTEEEMDKFYADCQRAADALFEREPFHSLKQRFNVIAVAAPSQHSGPSVPHDKVWKSTACGTHYDTFYSARYLTSAKLHHIYDLLTDVPFEHIMVLANTGIYGGGGIYNQITFATSDHPTFKQVFVHEFGHSYGGLGDEYAYDDMDSIWYPEGIEPWEPNLTTLTDFNSKWADMVGKVPGVGTYEGAGYQSKGCYRPVEDCRMRTNQAPDFCPVCTRAINRITDFYTK